MENVVAVIAISPKSYFIELLFFNQYKIGEFLITTPGTNERRTLVINVMLYQFKEKAWQKKWSWL